jgi:hypothetical protein
MRSGSPSRTPNVTATGGLGPAAAERAHHGVDRRVGVAALAVVGREPQHVARELVGVEAAARAEEAHAADEVRRRGHHHAGQLGVVERAVAGEAQGAHLAVAALAGHVLRGEPRRAREGEEDHA